MAQVTPIKYRMDYEPDDLVQVTLSQRMVGGEVRKRKVPKAKEDSIESVLQVMVEFDEVAQPTVLDFDGNDYYNNFRMVLPAVLREDWDEAVMNQAVAVAARTEDTFRACQRLWMTSFISDGSAEDLKEYIETTMKKDREDSIYHLVSRAKTLRKRHFQLLARGAAVAPVPDQRMTDRELIRAMFRGVPIDWQTEFQRHHNLRTCTIDEFQTFMTREKATFDAKQRAAQAQKERTKNKEKNQQGNNRANALMMGPQEEGLTDLIWTEQDKESMFSSTMYDCLADPQIQACFLHLPLEDGHERPLALDYPRLALHQQQDRALQQRKWQHPTQFPTRSISGTPLTAFQPTPTEDYKFCLPTQQLPAIVRWYHESLSHCGAERLYQSINAHFHHPQLRSTIKQICDVCNACQRNNLLGRKYGHLPARIAEALPWQEVHVDLIGPWEVQFQRERFDFYALTCIDPATGYPDAVRLQNKTARHTGLQFENLWCSRYPKPLRCRHDPGKEFVGDAFKQVLRRLNIAHKPCTVRNPQANSICERLHQTIGKSIRILLHHHPPQNVINVAELVDTAIATSLHAVRATVHSTLGVSPGAIVFHRDMLHDIPIIPNFQDIQKRRQAKIDYNLQFENSKRVDHLYRIGDEVLQIQHGPKKLDERATGPYTILHINQSGSVVIDKGNGIQQTLNIRWIRPYKRSI